MCVCMFASRFFRTNYMAENRNGRCLLPAMTLYVNRSTKSKLEPYESKHDIRIRVCTARANYFVAVFLFPFAVRTECFECRSEAEQ